MPHVVQPLGSFSSFRNQDELHVREFPFARSLLGHVVVLPIVQGEDPALPWNRRLLVLPAVGVWTQLALEADDDLRGEPGRPRQLAIALRADQSSAGAEEAASLPVVEIRGCRVALQVWGGCRMLGFSPGDLHVVNVLRTFDQERRRSRSR
jgi:hypothetical protein